MHRPYRRGPAPTTGTLRGVSDTDETADETGDETAGTAGDTDETGGGDRSPVGGQRRRPGLLGKLPGLLAQAPPGTVTTSARPASRWQVDRLEQTERRFSFAAAVVAVIFGVTIYVSETSDRHFHLAKNQLSPQTMLVLGLVLGALLVVTALVGRRGPVAFVALFGGIAFFAYGFLGLLFWILGFWLLYRGYKAQKAAAAARSAAGTSGPTRSTAGRGPGARDRGTNRAPSPSGPRRPPEANKRYTPKRPPPGAPRPSRRERRRAADGS